MQRRKSSANNGAAGAPGYPGAGAGYDQSAYPGYTQQPGYASPQPQVGYNQGYDSQGYTTQGYTGYGSSTGSNFGVGSGAAYPDSSHYTSTGRSSFSIKGKKRRDPSPSISLGFLFNRFVIVCVVAAILLIATIYYRSQYTTILNKFHTQSIVDAVKNYEKLEREKQRYQQESKTGQDQQRSLKNTIRELEKQNRELRKERDELQMKFDEEEDGIGAEEADKLKEREEAWRNQVYVLQNATARESKRAVLER
jgi:cobalamin biosynthesis Mg chelatase CobN